MRPLLPSDDPAQQAYLRQIVRAVRPHSARTFPPPRHARPNEPPSCPLGPNNYTCISGSLPPLMLFGSATAAEKVLIYTVETCLTEIYWFIVFLDGGVACRMEVFAFS